METWLTSGNAGSSVVKKAAGRVRAPRRTRGDSDADIMSPPGSFLALRKSDHRHRMMESHIGHDGRTFVQGEGCLQLYDDKLPANSCLLAGSIALCSHKHLPAETRLYSLRNMYLNYIVQLADGVRLAPGGSLYLPELQTLPERAVLAPNNDLYMQRLTAIPASCVLSAGQDMWFTDLTKLPAGYVLKCGGSMRLSSLSELPLGVSLIAGGDIWLPSLKVLPADTVLRCGRDLNLRSLIELAPGTTIAARNVYLGSLTRIPEGCTFAVAGCLDLHQVRDLPEGIELAPGGTLQLDSLEQLPARAILAPGGDLYLHRIWTDGGIDSRTIAAGRNMILPLGAWMSPMVSIGYRIYRGRLSDQYQEIGTSYLDRNRIPVSDKGEVTLYKRVSLCYKTQEDTPNETLWAPGAVLEHTDWRPHESECGPGKFHACGRPYWCDIFRRQRGDRYVAIRVHINDLYEWRGGRQEFPQKIAFRKGTVIGEVPRH